MLKSIRIETLKTLGISAGLVVAIAASGAFLVARAAPGAAAAPAGATFSSLADKSKGTTFAASCGTDMSVDLRPDPKWVGEAYADDNCWAPALPGLIDGYSADSTKVNGSMVAMQKYIVQAHTYQKCIANFVAFKQNAAEKGGKPLDKTVVVIENHRIAASRANEKKAATIVAIIVDQYNQNGSDCTDGGDITFQSDNGPAADGVSDAGNDLNEPG